jgi:hypothetical protein
MSAPTLATLADRDHWIRSILASDLPHAAVRVAVRIALHLHAESGRCNPGYDTLADELHTTSRSIMRAVTVLEQAGWLEVTRPGHHRPNQFGLLWGDKIRSGVTKPSPLWDDKTVTPEPVRGDKSGTSEVTPHVTHKGKKKRKDKRGKDSLAVGASLDSKNAGEAKKDSDSFAEFWSLYPRRVAKLAAQRAFAAALKRGASAAALIAGAQRYASERAGQDSKFTAHPSSWLNAGRYDDEPGGPPTIDQAGYPVATPQHQQQREPPGLVTTAEMLAAEYEAEDAAKRGAR